MRAVSDKSHKIYALLVRAPNYILLNSDKILLIRGCVVRIAEGGKTDSS